MGCSFTNAERHSLHQNSYKECIHIDKYVYINTEFLDGNKDHQGVIMTEHDRISAKLCIDNKKKFLEEHTCIMNELSRA